VAGWTVGLEDFDCCEMKSAYARGCRTLGWVVYVPHTRMSRTKTMKPAIPPPKDWPGSMPVVFNVGAADAKADRQSWRARLRVKFGEDMIVMCQLLIRGCFYVVLYCVLRKERVDVV